MNIALWIVQILLAGLFLMAGAFKTFTPIPELVAAGMAFAADVPVWVTRLAGAAEIVGAVGLVLPALTRIQPKLTGWAGVGLATVMLLALLLHLSRGEVGAVAPSLVLGGLAAFVAVGRLRLRPVPSRGGDSAELKPRTA